MVLDGVHLLLIDGPNLIRRIHAAIPPADTQQIIEQTITSTLQSLARALKQHAPTHVLCAFECSGPTWRHERFPDYKKDRPPMPEELNEIFSRLQQEISSHGVQVVQVDKMEADDVIASAAARAAAGGARVTILSTDTGQAQLLGPRVKQYNHFNQEEITEGSIQRRYGVRPDQINDYLALVGDKSHSLPGVPGIGAKTAAVLLTEYPGLESILAAADQIGGRKAEALTAHADMARMVRNLAALRTDVELGQSLRSFRYSGQPDA